MNYLYTVIVSSYENRRGRKGNDMKVKIDIEEGLEEEEVVIRCGSLNDSVISLQNYISKQNNGKRCLTLTSGETDFFVPIEEIYFFETEGRELRAHTADRIFTCGYKLYELEELLPGSFIKKKVEYCSWMNDTLFCTISVFFTFAEIVIRNIEKGEDDFSLDIRKF